MINPLISLSIGIIIILAAVIFFLPEKGILARRRKSRSYSSRIFVEDALKHLYNSYSENKSCNEKSIAESLSITREKTSKLIELLESMGLIVSKDNSYALTAEGKSYALRIIRTHRLWERFLADETSTRETDWHSEAELKEHFLTPDEADKLSAIMGNPLFDPHGDPIPSASGEIRSTKGKPLGEMENGEVAQIVHIEDEPPAAYAQLVAEGLYTGMHLRMIESSEKRIILEANGQISILVPLIASHITVASIPVYEKIPESYDTLLSLKIGETGEVIGISKACRGQQRRRLMDLGVVPGSKVTAELKGVGGDPVAYNIRGASIALRNEQAKQIYIKVLKEEMVEA